MPFFQRLKRVLWLVVGRRFADPGGSASQALVESDLRLRAAAILRAGQGRLAGALPYGATLDRPAAVAEIAGYLRGSVGDVDLVEQLIRRIRQEPSGFILDFEGWARGVLRAEEGRLAAALPPGAALNWPAAVAEVADCLSATVGNTGLVKKVIGRIKQNPRGFIVDFNGWKDARARREVLDFRKRSPASDPAEAILDELVLVGLIRDLIERDPFRVDFDAALTERIGRMKATTESSGSLRIEARSDGARLARG